MAKTRLSDVMNDSKPKGTLTKQNLRKGEHVRASDGLYFTDYYDENGKRRRITSKTLEGLREKKAELENRKAIGLRVSKSDRTLDNVYGEWVLQKDGLVPHTKNNYIWLYEHYVLNSDFGKMKIKDITKGTVKNHYNHLREQKGLAVTTVDGLQTVLRQVFQYAVEEHIIADNPTAGATTEMKRLSEKRQAHKALTADEQKRFLTYMKTHETYAHWYPIFKVLIGTGMRVTEASGLRWQDVDLEKGIIDVNHNLLYYSDRATKKMVRKVGKTKTKASKRTVVMVNGIKECFIAEKEWQEEQGIKCNAIVEGEADAPEKFYTDFVFLNKDGIPFQQGTLNKALRRIIRDANIEAADNEDIPMLPPFSCHCFRSTFVTRCAEKKVPIEVVMKQVGHDDKATTLRIYTTVHPDWVERELDAVADVFDD